jgi:DNA-binding beta-propeller fold protein YncE
MRMPKLVVMVLTLVLLAGARVALAQTDWSIEKQFLIGGEGRWDYLTLDPQTSRLYVPRTTHTMVIDAASGKTIADIPGQKNAHGVAIVPEVGRGFISDGGNGSIVVFDLKTNATLGTIVAQPDADGIIFDHASGRVLVVSGDNGVLMSLKPDIDPKSGTIDASPIELGGAPEFLASDEAGKVYINLMDKNEVAVVDLAAKKVIARWPVAPGGAPVGMSIDTEKHRLFIGCRKPQKLIVMSTDDGKVLASLPIGDTVDATKIDSGLVFASCRDGSLTVARETSPGKFEIIQTVKTGPGAATMELDSKTHTIYLPTAEFEQPKPGTTGRAAMKPGTFTVLVVSRHSAQ